MWLFLGRDFEFVANFAGSGYCGCGGLGTAFLVFGANGPAKGDLSIFYDDFDVMGVSRERLVVDESFANLPRHLAIIRRVLLLVSGRL